MGIIQIHAASVTDSLANICGKEYFPVRKQKLNSYCETNSDVLMLVKKIFSTQKLVLSNIEHDVHSEQLRITRVHTPELSNTAELFKFYLCCRETPAVKHYLFCRCF